MVDSPGCCQGQGTTAAQLCRPLSFRSQQVQHACPKAETTSAAPLMASGTASCAGARPRPPSGRAVDANSGVTCKPTPRARTRCSSSDTKP